MSTYRWFCDANDMALGRGLAMLRPDVLHPDHEDLPGVVPGTPDPTWIPIVASLGLVVITRDKRIRRRPGELLAWRNGGLRGFVLTGAGQQSTWDSVRLLVKNWSQMETIVTDRPDGPWMLAVTNSPLREISLDVEK